MRTLRFAFRSLKRQALITIINLTGLSLGIACSLLIGLYILDELKYDKFHAKADDIYRITTLFSSGGNESSYSNSATPIAPILPQDAPEVLTAARVYEREAAIQIIPASGSPTSDDKFREPHFVFADSTIFNIFSFDFIAGDAISSFSHINSVIITRRAAERYFGSVDVLGRQLLFEERLTLEITGVVNEWPEQSHLTFDLMAPFDNFFRLEDEGTANYLKTDWVYTPVSTYALLQPGASPAVVEEKLKGMVTKYGNEYAQGRVAHVLQPLTEIRLYSTFSGDSSSGRITELYVFGFVGLLTLLVACFNFINLSIVASLKRAKEAGIRKTLGAGKATLALQFLTESALTAGIGSLIGLLLAAYGITILNQLTDKHLTMSDLMRPDVAMLLVALLVFVVLVACTYPSIAFSATNPINSMRGTASHGGPAGGWLRKSLVVAQLGISVLLFSATLVVYNQMKFIRESPLGFQKEHMLLVPLFSSHINNVLGSGVDGALRQRMNTFEDALAKSPAVEASTLSSALPGQGAISALVTTDDIRPEDNVFFPAVAVDYDYLQAYDMELLAGRHFSREFGTDHLAAFIINEEALKVLGWQTTENAIGKNFAAMGKEGKVVGVIKNYHFQGLREAIQPLFLEVAASKFTTFTIRLKNSDIPGSLAFVEGQWNRIFPEKVFEFRFLDDQLDLIYQGEERLATLVTWFAGLSFLISSIGLFGIASFLHLRRTREIGIRKVLGARMLQLFATLSKEFFYLTMAAIAIMGPVSYFVMAEWLNGFAYRTGLGIGPFLASALVCGLVVFVTIAFQTYRSSRLDPVKALKYE